MKAQTNTHIQRTDGDTSAMMLRLRRKTDGGLIVAVVDDAAVVMRVQHGAGIAIAGDAKGDGSGIFGFRPAALPAGKSTLDYEIAVTEAGETDVYARGKIYTAKQITVAG